MTAEDPTNTNTNTNTNTQCSNNNVNNDNSSVALQQDPSSLLVQQQQQQQQKSDGVVAGVTSVTKKIPNNVGIIRYHYINNSNNSTSTAETSSISSMNRTPKIVDTTITTTTNTVAVGTTNRYDSIIIIAVGTATNVNDYDELSKRIVLTNPNTIVSIVDAQPYYPFKNNIPRFIILLQQFYNQFNTILTDIHITDKNNIVWIIGGHSAGGSVAFNALIASSNDSPVLQNIPIGGYIGFDPYSIPVSTSSLSLSTTASTTETNNNIRSTILNPVVRCMKNTYQTIQNSIITYVVSSSNTTTTTTTTSTNDDTSTVQSIDGCNSRSDGIGRHEDDPEPTIKISNTTKPPKIVKFDTNKLQLPSLYWGFSKTTCYVTKEYAAQAAYTLSDPHYRIYYQIQNDDGNNNTTNVTSNDQQHHDPIDHCCFTNKGCLACSSTNPVTTSIHVWDAISITVTEFIKLVLLTKQQQQQQQRLENDKTENNDTTTTNNTIRSKRDNPFDGQRTVFDELQKQFQIPTNLFYGKDNVI